MFGEFFFIKFYYFIALNKLHCGKSNVELFTSLSELCKSCSDFSLVWKNYTWSFNGGMSKVLGSYLLEKFATYQRREANLSLVFICWENPRRSGILLFPDFHRFCWLMKTQNHRYPQLPGMVWNNSRELRVFLFSWHIPDFCDGQRSLSTNENWNLYKYSKLLGSNPPTTHRRGISWERHKRKRKTSGNYSIYQQDMGWSEKIRL